MASDDPLQKSLFTRIKDCVLTELRRSNNDVKRSSCPSRSTWAWEIDDNGVRTKQPDSEERGQGQRSKDTNRKDKNDDAKRIEDSDRDLRHAEGRSANGHESIQKRSEQRSVNDDDYKKNHQRNNDGKNDSKREEIHQQKEEKKDERSHRTDIENKNEKQEKTHEINPGDAEPRSSSEKDKPKDQRDSCNSNRPKPVRYYIKMQNPEAPVCCESLIKPRKICPPKARRAQQEARDPWPRHTCRCGGCSSD